MIRPYARPPATASRGAPRRAASRARRSCPGGTGLTLGRLKARCGAPITSAAWKTRPDPPEPSADCRLPNRARTDVVVVGAGAIGVSTAYYLAQRGLSVTVVEQAGTVGAACSYGNAGLVSPSHCIPLARPGLLRRVPRWLRRDGSVHIRPRVSRELITFGLGVARASRPAPLRRGIRTLRDHCRASRDLFDELTAAGLDLGYQKNGLMNVCSSAEGFRALVRDAELLEGEGFRPEILDPNQARAREPQLLETISGGVFWDEDGQCEPARYVQSMADTARAAGADFRFDSKVTSFSTDAGGSISAVETEPGHPPTTTGCPSRRCP